MDKAKDDKHKEEGDDSAGAAAGGVQWDPRLVALVDAAVAKGNAPGAWDTFQAEVKTRPLTLVGPLMYSQRKITLK